MICNECFEEYQINEGHCAICPPLCLDCVMSYDSVTCTSCQNRTVLMPDGSCRSKYMVLSVEMALMLVSRHGMRSLSLWLDRLSNGMRQVGQTLPAGFQLPDGMLIQFL